MLTLPLHDLSTRSASGFLIRYVLPRSLPPQLIGPSDRKALFSTLTVGDVIIGVGHGSPSEFTGHNNQVLMNVSSIPNVKDKVVILVSCETAQQLGPALVNSGASSYIGFNKDLVWVCDAEKTSTPWTDKLALPVMGPITDCINTVLNGKTSGEAFDVLISDLSTNAELEEDELIKSCILYNMKNAVILGNSNTIVRKRPEIALPIGPPPLPPAIQI